MADMLLTLYCAAIDQHVIADALRLSTKAPLHLRDERVLGRDFTDAHAGEQVRGALRRVVIDLIVADSEVGAVVQAAGAARRVHPLRWHSVAVADRGRIV